MKKKHNKMNSQKEKNISENKMIEIQAEAYYRAIKRIKEEEKENNIEPNAEKYKWYENLLYFLNVFFFPWVINKRFRLNKHLYDGVLVFFVSAIMQLIGTVVWVVGIVGAVYALYQGIRFDEIYNMFSLLAISFLMMVLGSIITIFGNSFGEETNSERIYAYSACILGLISCAIGIISLLS